MNKKLIFLDIDGTLTEAGKNVPPASAVEAVKKAQENGHKVFLCTGRTLDMLSPLLKYGFDGVIGCSGGYITCGDEIIYDHPMTTKERDLIMNTLGKNHIFRTIECNDGSFTDEGFKEFLEEHANEGSNSELLRWRRQIEENLKIRPMSQYSGTPAYKMVYMCVSAEDIAEPREILGSRFNMIVQDPDAFGIINGEIISKEFDKGQAVKRVAEHYGMDISDTIGYGDSMNDLEMIEVVGHSVCMANGSETLKKLAKEVCPAVTEDGLYQSFKLNGLI